MRGWVRNYQSKANGQNGVVGIEGEKLVEITSKNFDYFEDRFSIGSGKKWYYFIKVYNNYGEDIESEVTQGDTRL